MTDVNSETILLVVDETRIAIIETTILKKCGYNVIHVNTGGKGPRYYGFRHGR